MTLKNTMFLERIDRQASNQKLYTSRFYNGECGLAGICLLDPESGLDIALIKKGLKQVIIETGGTINDELVNTGRFQTSNLHRAPSEDFCQVTVEERTQLFGFMKKG